MASSRDGGSSITTSHAEKRVRQRIGIPSKAVDREVSNAFARGIRREKFKGKLRRYLDTLYHTGKDTGAASDIVVYNNNIFLFAGQYLVTTWPVPKALREKKVGKIKELPDSEED